VNDRVESVALGLEPGRKRLGGMISRQRDFARLRHLSPHRSRSETMTSRPSPASAATRFEPMNPAPPVTRIIRGLYGGERRARMGGHARPPPRMWVRLRVCPPAARGGRTWSRVHRSVSTPPSSSCARNRTSAPRSARSLRITSSTSWTSTASAGLHDEAAPQDVQREPVTAQQPELGREGGAALPACAAHDVPVARRCPGACCRGLHGGGGARPAFRKLAKEIYLYWTRRHRLPGEARQVAVESQAVPGGERDLHQRPQEEGNRPRAWTSLVPRELRAGSQALRLRAHGKRAGPGRPARHRFQAISVPAVSHDDASEHRNFQELIRRS